MANNMANTASDEKVWRGVRMVRRQYGTGSIHQRKDGRWVGTIEAGWTARGTRRRLVVTAKTEAECKTKLDKKQRQVIREGIPATTREPTVAEWAEKWLDITAHELRPRSWRTNASAVKVWIKPVLGRERLSRLGVRHVRNVMDEMRAADRSANTMRRTHSVLMTMLKAAVAEGYTVAPAVLAQDAPSPNESGRDAIPLDDVYKLLEAAGRTTGGSRWLAAIANGMRKNECLGLTWACVDLDKAVVDISWQLQVLPYVDRANKHMGFRVPDGFTARRLTGAWHLVRPKTQKGQRVIPLIPPMVDALRAWKAIAPQSDHDLVWPRVDGRPQDEKADAEAWRALQTEAGVRAADRPYELHEARHTTATLLMEEGIDAKIIEAIMGHSSILTSRGYMHVSALAKRQAAEAIGRRLKLGAGAEPPAVES